MAAIHSQVFTKAHIIAKGLRDNQGFEYRAAFSIALRRVWKEYRSTGNVSVVVKSVYVAKVRIPAKREKTLKLAESFLRTRLELKGEFPVTYLTAKSFERGTMGYIAHGKNPYIHLRNQKSLRETVACLAHELVHAQQVERGSLKSLGYGMRLWNGEKMAKGETYEEYRATPWEAEAFDRMYGLADEFLATI